MIRADYQQVEELAAQICHLCGGDWSRPYTKRAKWRAKALALIALANGDKAEADRVMGRKPA